MSEIEVTMGLINNQTLHAFILNTMTCIDIEYDYLLWISLLKHILKIDELLSDLFFIHVVHFYDVLFTHVVFALEKFLCIVAIALSERNIYVSLLKHSIEWGIGII